MDEAKEQIKDMIAAFLEALEENTNSVNKLHAEIAKLNNNIELIQTLARNYLSSSGAKKIGGFTSKAASMANILAGVLNAVKEGKNK